MVKTEPLEHRFVIEARPVAKDRPRRSRNGGVYTPSKTHEAEKLIAAHYDGPWFGDALVAVEMDFAIDHTVVTIRELDVERSKLRGDVDNYIKTTGDALNGVAFADDKQIYELRARKL